MINTVACGGGDRVTCSALAVLACACAVLSDSLMLGGGGGGGRSHAHPAVWQNPCGLRSRTLARKRYHAAAENEVSPDGVRHPSARPLRRVRTQLRITYNHFRSEPLQKDIVKVYSSVKNQLKEEFEYDWLPGRQLAWYRSAVKCLDKKSKVEVLLPSLHGALQNFSATFEELRHYGGESQLSEHHDLFWTRRNLLADISHQVKKLLCEVETAILDVGAELPTRLPAEAGAAMIWDARPDHTAGLIQDWGVLAAYRAFLDDWLKIVRRLVGAKGNLPCKPHVRARHHRRRKGKGKGEQPNR